MLSKADFLVSMPSLRGDYFQSTVICMLDHSDEGAFGLVVNKPLDISPGEIFEELEDNLALQILEGGPVEQDRLFFLHTADKQYDQTLKINQELCLTTSEALVADLANQAGPMSTLALLGYAGWGPGQLESEITTDAWLVTPFDAGILFSADHDNKPRQAAASMGVDLNLIGPRPGHG